MNSAVCDSIKPETVILKHETLKHSEDVPVDVLEAVVNKIEVDKTACQWDKVGNDEDNRQ